MPIRLLVISDVRLYREGMQSSLATRPRFSTVEAVADADGALRVMAKVRPDVVIVDMATRHSLDIVRDLRQQCDASTRIVGFGVEEVEGEILALAEAGLAGYVPSDASLDDLVERVDAILRGELLCTPRMAAAMFRHIELRGPSQHTEALSVILTTREREVLKLIDRGLSNKEIAGALHIEVSTVKNHVHNVLEKLDVPSRLQAAARLGGHVSVRQRSTGPAAPADLV